MAAAQAENGRRGVLRPFHRWPLSARHDHRALAARQETATMHHGAAPAEVGAAGNVAPQAKVGSDSTEALLWKDICVSQARLLIVWISTMTAESSRVPGEVRPWRRRRR